MAAVAALWENVVDTDIIRLDTSRFDIATSLAGVLQLICYSCDWLSCENSRPTCIRGAVLQLGYQARGAPAVR